VIDLQPRRRNAKTVEAEDVIKTSRPFRGSRECEVSFDRRISADHDESLPADSPTGNVTNAAPGDEIRRNTDISYAIRRNRQHRSIRYQQSPKEDRGAVTGE
jgi:hypothetical protein